MREPILRPQDWNVAVIDGQPEEVITLEGVARILQTRPEGPQAALEKLRPLFPAEHFATLEQMIGGEPR